jgi:hypothetical protein
MLGRSNESGRSIQLYVQLVYPAEVPVSDLKDPANAPMTCAPTGHRVGHLWFEARMGKKLLRVVHLRAYSFFLAFFAPGERAAVRDDFSQQFLNRHSHTALLKASQKSVALVCDGVSAWESLRGTRGNTLHFE